jgi:hypothetical protein
MEHLTSVYSFFGKYRNKFRFIKLPAMVLLLLIPINQIFAGANEPQYRPDWAGIWGIWGGENYGGPEWPWYKGTIIHTSWKNIEPNKGQWDFSGFDANLKKAADKGLYIGIKVYQGDVSPDWIYEHGVPRVKSSNNKTYPYYLDSDFKPLFFNMINKVAEHVKTLPECIRDRIVVVQAPAGKSGDPQPYAGTVPEEYQIDWTTGQQWRDWNREVFTEYARAFSDMDITLIIKPNESLHEYFKEEMPALGRKTWSTAQGYQANNEMTYEWLRQDLVKYNGEYIIRGRGEFDHAVRENRPWFAEAPKWNMYWQCLWMLQYGLDMFNQRTQALDDPSNYIEAYTFFTDHAGYKSARDSKTAWCALRDGLDYLDTERFPESIYGSAEKSDNKSRYDAIIKAMAPFGAHQGDPNYFGTGLHPYYINLKALNDVAYNIWPGNYRNFLYQIDANQTSQGYWRVGPKSQPYGRFARGFNHEEGKDTLFFDIDDEFFSDNKLNNCEVTVRVVYFDEGEGSWALKYHASDDTEKTAYTLTKTNTGQWKEKSITISDGMFSNGCKKNADLMLVNTDNQNDIFHMVEINLNNCLPTGAKKLKDNSSKQVKKYSAIKIYPSPAGDEVFVKLPAELLDYTDVTFYDMNGDLVKKIRGSLENTRISYNVKKFPAGVYCVVLESEGVIYKGKFVKL